MELLSFMLGFGFAMILYLWGDTWAIKRTETDKFLQTLKDAVERAEKLSKK